MVEVQPGFEALANGFSYKVYGALIIDSFRGTTGNTISPAAGKKFLEVRTAIGSTGDAPKPVSFAQDLKLLDKSSAELQPKYAWKASEGFDSNVKSEDLTAMHGNIKLSFVAIYEVPSTVTNVTDFHYLATDTTTNQSFKLLIKKYE